MENLIMSHLWLTKYLARKIGYRSPVLDVDDLAASGALALVRASYDYDPGLGTFFSYVYRRVYGAMIDEVRRMTHKGKMKYQYGLPEGFDEKDFTVVVDNAHDLAGALRSLSDRYRKVLVLRNVEGKTFKEIGALFGVGESRACQIHSRAVKRLRELLQIK